MQTTSFNSLGSGFYSCGRLTMIDALGQWVRVGFTCQRLPHHVIFSPPLSLSSLHSHVLAATPGTALPRPTNLTTSSLASSRCFSTSLLPTSSYSTKRLDGTDSAGEGPALGILTKTSYKRLSRPWSSLRNPLCMMYSSLARGGRRGYRPYWQ